MKLISTLRQKMLPLYLAIFAILLPALVQVAQAIPVSAATSGYDISQKYLVICTGQGIVYAPQPSDSSRPESQSSYGFDFCPVCTSFSIAQNTFTLKPPCFSYPENTTGSNLAFLAKTPLKVWRQRHHRPRAPPFQFNNHF